MEFLPSTVCAAKQLLPLNLGCLRFRDPYESWLFCWKNPPPKLGKFSSPPKKYPKQQPRMVFHQPVWLMDQTSRSKVTVQAQVVMNVSGSKHWVDGEGTGSTWWDAPWVKPKKDGETFPPERLQNVKNQWKGAASPKESTYENGSKVFFLNLQLVFF